MASNIHKQHDQELAEMVEDQDPRLQDPQECHQFCTDRLARLATWPRANSLMTKLHWTRDTSIMVQKRAAPHGENGSEGT